MRDCGAPSSPSVDNVANCVRPMRVLAAATTAARSGAACGLVVGGAAAGSSREQAASAISVPTTSANFFERIDSVPWIGGIRIWRGSRVVINESC
jgi:hypothetical protein